MYMCVYIIHMHTCVCIYLSAPSQQKKQTNITTQVNANRCNVLPSLTRVPREWSLELMNESLRHVLTKHTKQQQ